MKGSLVPLPAASTRVKHPGKRQFYVRNYKCLLCKERLSFDIIDGETCQYCSCQGWQLMLPAEQIPADVLEAERQNRRGIVRNVQHARKPL